MNIVEITNQQAKEKRKEFFESSKTTHNGQLNELSKTYPFYGYIDIKVAELEPFVMFSNNDDYVARYFFWHGSDAYEATSLKIWQSLAKTSPTILDIGSYTGIYALAASKANPRSKVFAFEALDRVYFRLIINKEVNHAGNLKIFNKAVSNIEGSFKFNIYSGDAILVSASSLVEKHQHKTIHEIKRVSTIALDNFIREQNVNRLGLMKIDTEGAEHLVLEGAQQIIKRDAPDILVEILKDADLEAILGNISSQPYNFYQIDDSKGTIKQVDKLTTSSGMHNLNTLLTCKSKDEIESLLQNRSESYE